MAIILQRLVGIRLNARAPEALAAFFVAALGFEHTGSSDHGQILRLGETRLEIAHATGHAYPADVPGWSLLFQHFAITTTDMAAAFAQLRRQPRWTAITVGEPQQLPARSGGVTAFKFRDPEGHPLELIGFPADTAAKTPARIDHSAVSVIDTARSIAFYRSLGLALGAQSLNHGPEQDRLDGLNGARVDVTALTLPAAGAHVELLGYAHEVRPAIGAAGVDDVAATQLMFTVDHAQALEAIRLDHAGRVVRADQDLLLRDPDGHLLRIEIAA